MRAEGVKTWFSQLVLKKPPPSRPRFRRPQIRDLQLKLLQATIYMCIYILIMHLMNSVGLKQSGKPTNKWEIDKEKKRSCPIKHTSTHTHITEVYERSHDRTLSKISRLKSWHLSTTTSVQYLFSAMESFQNPRSSHFQYLLISALSHFRRVNPVKHKNILITTM